MEVSEDEFFSASSSRPSLYKYNSSSGLPFKNNPHGFYLARTALRGSIGVLQAVRGHFRSPSSYDVVFSKETSIELVLVDQDGIFESISEQPVFDTIKNIEVLPWNERFQVQRPNMQGKDILLVISDSGNLSFLTFCNERLRFFLLTHVRISAHGNSRHQFGRMLAVDSSGYFVAASAYEDQLAIFSLSMSQSGDIIDKKIFCPSKKDGCLKTGRGSTSIAGTILSMCFISQHYNQPNKVCKPVIAILLNRSKSIKKNELLLLEWNIEQEDVHVVYQFDEAGPLAYHIIEVPRSYGYVFLFRAGDIVLMDCRNVRCPSCVYRTSSNFTPMDGNKSKSIIRIPDIMDKEGIYNVAAYALLERGDDPMNSDDYSSVQPVVCSWCSEPGIAQGAKILFSVDLGDLYAIEVLFESDSLRVNLSDSLYKGEPFNALLWLDGFVAASRVGMDDWIVLKFEEGFLQYKSSIPNIAPILDQTAFKGRLHAESIPCCMCIVDNSNEKHDQMFACSVMAPERSLRVIRSGYSVEKLSKTDPIYHGITGTWTIKMKVSDPYHSFLVLSFLKDTRVLSVGVIFSDVTEKIGFQPDVCTLACGVVSDGVMVQIHRSEVRLCLPAGTVHSKGTHLSSPVCTSWFPDNMNINLGSVGNEMILVGTSSPYFLFVLGIRSALPNHFEVYQMHSLKLANELSSISIPQKDPMLNAILTDYAAHNSVAAFPSGNHVDHVFVIGTRKPSVEVVSFTPEKGLQVLAVGITSSVNTMGSTISECTPQDVKFVLVDHLYVLSGLKNGMLLTFEFPYASTLSTTGPPGERVVAGLCTSDFPVMSNSSSENNKVPPMLMSNTSGKAEQELPVNLQLIDVRRIGITPVFLVPLGDSPGADVIALSDRTLLLEASKQSLSYTSIFVQSSTHATHVCSAECPQGILFVTGNSLHLVRILRSKSLNVQKFHLDGTPRKVLYHNDSSLLLVMRTNLDNDPCSSDICFVDPLSGSILSSFEFEPGETGTCMDLVKDGNEHVLVIGTSLSDSPTIMPGGKAQSSKGRLVILCLEHTQKSDCGSVTRRNSPIGGYAAEQLSGNSLCICPDDNRCDGETQNWHFRLAYSDTLPMMVTAVCPYRDRYFLASVGNYISVWQYENGNCQSLRRLEWMVRSSTIVTAHPDMIAVGGRDNGITFYSLCKGLPICEEVQCDPVRRTIYFTGLPIFKQVRCDPVWPVVDCLMTDRDTAFVSDTNGKVVVLSSEDREEDDLPEDIYLSLSCSYYMGEILMSMRKKKKGPSMNSIIAYTPSGSIMIFTPLTREEYDLLKDVQARLLEDPLTAPILGNDHNEFRSSGSPARVSKMLDGDILAQFLELSSIQQEAVLASLPKTVTLSSKLSLPAMVVRLLNKVLRLP